MLHIDNGTDSRITFGEPKMSRSLESRGLRTILDKFKYCFLHEDREKNDKLKQFLAIHYQMPK